MSRRRYEQPCSLARALDRIGERWSLLIVRELSLGPLRFSDLGREVGGAPTDILTRRLRDLEADGIVRRRDLDPPASTVVYELTEIGRSLERPMLELGRWGMHYFEIEEAATIDATLLPNALRIILDPPAGMKLAFVVESDGVVFSFRIADGWVAAERGRIEDPDLVISGAPVAVLATVASGVGDMNREFVENAIRDAGEQARVGEIVLEGDLARFDELLSAVVLPEQIRTATTAEPAPTALSG